MSEVANRWTLTDSKTNAEVGKDQTVDAGGKGNLGNRETQGPG